MLKTFALITLTVSVMVAAAGCSQTDAGITTAVKTRFATDDTVKAYQINVDTKNGVVTLSGAVETPAAKDQAVRLARETEGVTEVADNLTVNAAATVGERAEEAAREAGRDIATATVDAGVTAAVKTKLLADTMVRGLKIDVDTRGGVVTLSGTVRAAERERAVTVARGTEGVKDVVDKLVSAAAPAASQSAAYAAGYERGMTEGRQAGREERVNKRAWDLEGQSELDTADSGYQPGMGSKADYQAGYREGFRRAYREGWDQTK